MGKSKRQTVGYRYKLGVHMVFCHGPIDSISEIRVEDKVVWDQGISSSGTININKPNIFGGDTKDGGISGDVDFMFGEPTQGANSYLKSKLTNDLPAFRGVVSAVLNRVYMGVSSYIKPWSFVATRILTRQDGIPQWYSEKAAIANLGPGKTKTAKVRADSIPPGRRDRFSIIADNSGYVLETSEHSVVTITPIRKKKVIPASVTGIGSDISLNLGGTLNFLGVDPNEDGWRWPLGLTLDDSSFMVLSPSGDPQFPAIEDAFQAAKDAGPWTLTGYSKYRFTPHLENNEQVLSWEHGGLAFRIKTSPPPDMNPAHIIRECLTDPDWGMGYSDTDIDDASFTSVADTLFTEGLGMSILWDQQQSIEDFILTVLKHIDGSLYVSRKTGKFVLVLTRADYDESSLITLDESSISKVSDSNKPEFSELKNSVTVTFWDASTNKKSAVTISDSAMIKMHGQELNHPVEYLGFTSSRNATIAAQRDLKTLSSSILSCTIYCDRTAKDLNIGSVFKFSWARWKISNMVMRVTGIAFGDGKSNVIRINCVQDVFSTPDAPILEDEGSEWIDTVSEPEPLIHEIAQEVPYYELVQSLGESTVNDTLAENPGSGYVMMAAAREGSSVNVRLWTDFAAGSALEDVGSFDFCPMVALDEDITPTQTEISYFSDLDVDDITIGTYFQIGATNETAEICRLDAIDETSKTMTIGRGVLDTTPKSHSINTILFFIDEFNGVDPTEYSDGEEVELRGTPSTGADDLELSEASSNMVTLESRAIRPYPPGNLLLNSESYPDVAMGLRTLTWAHRDRRQQTSGTLFDHTYGDIGPESGTTYQLKIYEDDVLISTVEPASSGETFTPAVNKEIRVEVRSKRDGFYSMQPASHTFFSQIGETRTLENNISLRSSEDGNTRMTED